MGGTEMGEYLAGAYLEIVEGCDFVKYNVRPPGGGIGGLNELDVLGLRFADSTAFLCEVTTHLEGVNYGQGNRHTFERIRGKYGCQRAYAADRLRQFSHRFLFWAPVVPSGSLLTELQRLEGLELVVNEAYRGRVDRLRAEARVQRQDTGNPAFRMLQILEALRG